MNEIFPLSLVVGAFGMLIACFTGVMLHAERKHELRKFARRVQGWRLSDGFLTQPLVRFYLDDIPTAIEFSQSKRYRVHPRLTVPLPIPRLRLELSQQSLANPLSKFLGMQDLEIGDRQFDASKPLPIEETECFVCGDPLRGRVVCCAKCPPHHVDGWQYFGSCAIYGCGQRSATCALDNGQPIPNNGFRMSIPAPGGKFVRCPLLCWRRISLECRIARHLFQD